MVYGKANAAFQNFSKGFADTFNQTLQGMSNGFASFVTDLSDRFEKFGTFGQLSAMASRADNIFQEDVISTMSSLEAMQNAKPIMRRFIMANPTVRELFHKDRCFGYGEDYVDNHPGTLGEDHYDYRRVMDEVVFINDDDVFEVVNYGEELEEDEIELNIIEKRDIINTWEWCEYHMDKGNDVTDPEGGAL